MLLQWNVKDPSHSAKSAGGRLHLNTHTPLNQQRQSGLTMPLSKHSVGTYQEMSSHTTCQGTLGQLPHLAEPLWTDPGLRSGISVHKLIYTLKKKKSAGGDLLVKHSPQILTREEKATTTTIWKT